MIELKEEKQLKGSITKDRKHTDRINACAGKGMKRRNRKKDAVFYSVAFIRRIAFLLLFCIRRLRFVVCTLHICCGVELSRRLANERATWEILGSPLIVDL